MSADVISFVCKTVFSCATDLRVRHKTRGEQQVGNTNEYCLPNESFKLTLKTRGIFMIRVDETKTKNT